MQNGNKDHLSSKKIRKTLRKKMLLWVMEKNNC